MDDNLFEELHGIKKDTDEDTDEDTDDDDDYDYILSLNNSLEEKLNQPVVLLESELKFDNFLEFIEYINTNIYLKDDYYCFKIKYNSYHIEWIFRSKEKIFQNIMKTFQFESLFIYYSKKI